MTVSQRLYSLIASAVIGLMSLSGIGYYQVGKVFSSANFANENTVPALVALDDLRTNILQIRIDLNNIINTDNDKRSEFERTLAKNIKDVKDAIKLYETTIADEKDKFLFEQERTLFSQYEPWIESFLL